MSAKIYTVNQNLMNPNKVKYLTNKVIKEEVIAIIWAIKNYNPDFEPNTDDLKTKEQLVEAYKRFVTIWNDLCAKIEEVEAEKAVKEMPTPKAPKVTKAKPAKEQQNVNNHRGTAQERLDKYSAELTERESWLKANPEAPKEDIKVVVKRIASLKRKIERANTAMGNSTADESQVEK